MDREQVRNEVFNFSIDGGCCYYPSGYYKVNEDLFTCLVTETRRPVYIFRGASNLGKSHLASLTGKSVFETDSVKNAKELPETITADIIVVGNRWEVTDITSRIYGDAKIINIDFYTV